MKHGKKSVPLLMKIMIPMIALSVLQILMIVAIMSLNGEFALIKKFSYNSLSEKTENRGGYVENILSRKTAMVYEAAEEINAAVGQILAEEGLSAAAVSEDRELNKRILSGSVGVLIDLIRRDAVNDAFCFLTAGPCTRRGRRKHSGALSAGYRRKQPERQRERRYLYGNGKLGACPRVRYAARLRLDALLGRYRPGKRTEPLLF